MEPAISPTSITVSSLPVVSLVTAARDHAEKLFEITNNNRRYLKQWLPWLDSVQNESDSLNFIEHNAQLASQGKGVQFIIFQQNTPIGVAGFHNRDTLYRRADIGYWLAQQYCGKGIMTKTVESLLEYGFTTLQLRKISIRCATTNARSRKIPERLGFTLEHIRKRCEWLYDHYVDHAVYTLIIDDFQKSQHHKK